MTIKERLRACVFSCAAALSASACAPENEPQAETPADADAASVDATADNQDGRYGGAPSAADDAGAAQPVMLPVIDAMGPQGRDSARVRDIAFWSHPTLAFNSLVLTGGDDGLKAYNIETGAIVGDWRADPVDALDVAYAGRGPEARGIVVVADDGVIAAYEIDNSDSNAASGGPGRRAQPVGEARAAIGAASGLCVVSAVSGKTVNGAMGDAMDGYAVSGGALFPFSIRLNKEEGANVSVGAEQKAPLDTTDCVFDDASGDLYLLTASGDVYRQALADSAPVPFASTGVASARTIGLALKRNKLKPNAEGSQTPEPMIAVLNGETAAVSLIDADGRALGVIRLSASFDHPGVQRATALGLGYGNYGAVYRDGALVLGADDNAGPPVRLVPFNGVLNALNQPLGGGVDPRAPMPSDEAPDPLDFTPPAPVEP